MGLAAAIYYQYIMRAYAGEALSNAATLKEIVSGHYYRTGEWSPADPGIFDYSDGSRAIKSIDYEKGGFTFSIKEEKRLYKLSFRAALSDTNPRSTIIWLCGYGEAPNGYHTISTNSTNLPRKYLPVECRGLE